MRKQRTLAGFTLIELAIVLVVISLLAALAIPAYDKSRRNSYRAIMLNDARQIGAAMQIIASEYPGIPAGTVCTITIGANGVVTSTAIPFSGGMVPVDAVTQHVHIIGKLYSVAIVPYTFESTGTAFTLQSAYVVPKDVNPSSKVNVSMVPDTPVAFDAEGKVL